MEGLFFFLKRALHSHKIPTFYLIKSQSRLYFYYHYRQWLIRILLYESFGVLVPLFFQVFVIPCVSGEMPVDDSVSLPHGFRGTTRSGDCLHVCPLATLKQMNRRKKKKSNAVHQTRTVGRLSEARRVAELFRWQRKKPDSKRGPTD